MAVALRFAVNDGGAHSRLLTPKLREIKTFIFLTEPVIIKYLECVYVGFGARFVAFVFIAFEHKKALGTLVRSCHTC